jgi:hypothetical protein
MTTNHEEPGIATPHQSWLTFIEPVMNELDAELETFQWAYPDRNYNRGEIHVERESGQLVMVVWCRDNDDPDNEEVKPLRVSRGITTQEPRQQIRGIIHEYLCHEADEQIWFGNERPFYPHT